MKEKLEQIKQRALEEIQAVDGMEKLNEIRVAFLGKKGELTKVLKSMKDVPPEDRNTDRRSSGKRKNSACSQNS